VHGCLSVVSVVLSGRGLCNGPIPRPEESYRLWCVIVCDLETSRMRRLKPTAGCNASKKCMVPRALKLPNSLSFLKALSKYRSGTIEVAFNIQLCGHLTSISQVISISVSWDT
jgi:hypothetical protein